MPLREDQLLWEIEEQHLDEAEFLFEVREAALDAPNYTLDEIAEGPERRLLAHVDALSLAGPQVAERLLFPVIEDEHGSHEAVAAAILAVLLDGPAELRERALAALDLEGGEARLAGLVRGLQLGTPLSKDPSLEHALLRSLSSARGAGLAARLEVLAGRQVAAGAWLAEHLASADPQVARAAARLARFSSEPSVLERLAPLAQSEDPQLRRVTVETALCRGLGGAWESALYWAFEGSDAAIRGDALVWVALLGNAGTHERLLALLDDPPRRAEALWALGFGGRVAAVDRCMTLLDDEEHAALAGELVCAIAGLPTEEDALWREPAVEESEEALPDLQADDLESDLVPTGEEALPLPEPAAVAAWWAERRGSFDPALRYLGGRPLDGGVLLDALGHGPARRRHVLALELAMRTQGRVVLPTRALVRPQRAALARATELGPVDCQRGRT